MKFVGSGLTKSLIITSSPEVGEAWTRSMKDRLGPIEFVLSVAMCIPQVKILPPQEMKECFIAQVEQVIAPSDIVCFQTHASLAKAEYFLPFIRVESNGFDGRQNLFIFKPAAEAPVHVLTSDHAMEVAYEQALSQKLLKRGFGIDCEVGFYNYRLIAPADYKPSFECSQA